MNKSDFIKAVAKSAELTQIDAGKFFEAFVNVVSDTLKAGEQIVLSGFGSFDIKDRAEREGINPQTGEHIHIAATKAPGFKFSPTFKETL